MITKKGFLKCFSLISILCFSLSAWSSGLVNETQAVYDSDINGKHTNKKLSNTASKTTATTRTVMADSRNSPYGLENIIIEKYYISDTADAAKADAEIDQYNSENGTSLPPGALPVGSVTYRFYADLKPGYKLLAVYADETRSQSMIFTTTTSFYNHLSGSLSPVPGTSKAAIKNNLLALDTYFSLGGVAIGNYGILKTADNGVANNVTSTGNANGVLLNADPDMGIPLTVRDGMIGGTGVVAASFAGFSGLTHDAFMDGTVISNSLKLLDGSVFSVDGAMGSDTTNRILIAQVTTNGTLHYEFNLLLKDSLHNGEFYVASNPEVGDVLFTPLKGDLVNSSVNTAPVVTISSPANNVSILQGTSVTITADVSDPGDIIASVQFFADDSLIGSGNTAPYQTVYPVKAGNQLLTVKATDDEGLQSTSSPILIKGVSSIPSVTITSPSANTIFSINTTIQIAATATDALSGIDSVTFLVDGISIGSDVTAPYTISYITTSGVHQLTAKAINGDGISAISSPIQIMIPTPSTVKGLEEIYVEKYYISNAADAAQADLESLNQGLPTGSLPVGSVTYRFYADLLPGYELVCLYGDDNRNQSLKFITSTSFYNHPAGQVSPVPGTSKTSLKNNLLALDTYLTLGGVATNQYGIPKTDDDNALNNVTVASNPAGVLLNVSPSMLPALTSRDGMIGGSNVSTPSFSGFSQTTLDALGDGSIIADTIELTDGTVFNTNGSTGPLPGPNKLLIAQITTNGILNYELNLTVIKTDDPTVNEFYAAHPQGNDLFVPTLLGTLNPNSEPYSVKTTSGVCTSPSFCLPITANDNVKNVIGYDIVLGYDKTKVHPTGNIDIKNNLIHPGYASYVMQDDVAAGELNISVFLNANAPDNTTFKGTGELMCILFSKDPFLPSTDTVPFTILSLQESYANGVITKPTDAGQFINKTNTVFTGSLKFWSDNSPIKYNSDSPSQYLVTNIFGTDANCANKSASPAKPDFNGNFTHDLLNGFSIQIERDIAPFTDVQPVINGFDASLGHKVLVNDLSFIPSIYQVIALDVNTDGVISAGDISQLNQRSVKTISEFKQKWNYDSNGNSTGIASKDWLFVNDTLLAKPTYKISATYPANDNTGYSKFKVPVVPFCLKVPNPLPGPCPIYEQTSYTGVLLGDVNGNYDAIPADGEIKRIAENNEGSVYLNLDQATSGMGYVDVPVSFASSKKINALDFAIRTNEKLRFDKIITPAAYLTDAMANLATDDRIIRFTSNSRQPYEELKPVVSIRFISADGQLKSSDLVEMIAYLNGEPVNMKTKGNFTTTVSNSSLITQVVAYPNPANNVLNIASTATAVAELIDLQGRQIVAARTLYANEKQEINTENIASGTYLLKVYNDHFVSTQRIVIENNK
jgi:hypothetical protein